MFHLLWTVTGRNETASQYSAERSALWIAWRDSQTRSPILRIQGLVSVLGHILLGNRIGGSNSACTGPPPHRPVTVLVINRGNQLRVGGSFEINRGAISELRCDWD